MEVTGTEIDLTFQSPATLAQILRVDREARLWREYERFTKLQFLEDRTHCDLDSKEAVRFIELVVFSVASDWTHLSSYDLITLRIVRARRGTGCSVILEYTYGSASHSLASTDFNADRTIPGPELYKIGIRQLFERMERSFQIRNALIERGPRNNVHHKELLLRDLCKAYQFLKQDLEDPATCDMTLDEKLDFLRVVHKFCKFMQWDCLSHRIGMKLVVAPPEIPWEGTRVALRFMDPIFLDANERNLFVTLACKWTVSNSDMEGMYEAMKLGLRSLAVGLRKYTDQW